MALAHIKEQSLQTIYTIKNIYQKAIFVKSILIILGLALTLSACNAQRISNFPSHKLAIEQGNELDPAAVAQLQKGLTKAQVRSLLGSPLLMDPFHQNRWDYIYQTTRNGVAYGERTQLTVYFEDDSVVRFESKASTYGNNKPDVRTDSNNPVVEVEIEEN